MNTEMKGRKKVSLIVSILSKARMLRAMQILTNANIIRKTAHINVGDTFLFQKRAQRCVRQFFIVPKNWVGIDFWIRSFVNFSAAIDNLHAEAFFVSSSQVNSFKLKQTLNQLFLNKPSSPYATRCPKYLERNVSARGAASSEEGQRRWQCRRPLHCQHSTKIRNNLRLRRVIVLCRIKPMVKVVGLPAFQPGITDNWQQIFHWKTVSAMICHASHDEWGILNRISPLSMTVSAACINFKTLSAIMRAASPLNAFRKAQLMW